MLDEGTTRDRATRLFRFLYELKLLETRPVYRTESYEQVLWLHDIPRARGCWRIGWPGGDGRAIVEVQKPHLSEAPIPPEDLLASLDERIGFRDSTTPPRLAEAMAGTEAAELLRRLEEYLTGVWRSWAADDSVARATQEVFARLFSMYQKLEASGDRLELVLGFGQLAWRTPSGHTVSRHILTAPVVLKFDTARGVMKVRPADSRWLELEQDMLEVDERPAAAARKDVEAALAELEPGQLDEEALRRMVTSWTNALSPDSRFDARDEPTTAGKEHPAVTWAPALMVRRRNQGAIVCFLKSIVEQLEAGGTIPEPIARMVGFESGAETVELKVEPLLPLPANDEQRELVRKVMTRTGVVVQGPPGTGKSHTIANLISHLLASGCRVLVTSHAARALKVLRGRLPNDIARLCVPLLGHDTEDQLALSETLNGLQARAGAETDREASERVAELEQRLETARQTEKKLLRGLRTIRENEVYTYRVAEDYSGSAQRITQLVQARAATYSWMKTRPDEHEAAPMTEAEIAELTALLDSTDGSLPEARDADVVILSRLPVPVDINALVEAELEARAGYEAAATARSHPSYAAILGLEGSRRRDLAGEAAGLARQLTALQTGADEWLATALADVLSGSEHRWLDLAAISHDALGPLRQAFDVIGEPDVTGVEGRELSELAAHAHDLLSHLRKGHGLGFGPLRPRVVRNAEYLLNEARIDGRACNTVEALEALVNWADVRNRLARLARTWADCDVEVRATTARVQLGQVEALAQALDSVAEFNRRLAEFGRQVSAAGLPRLACHDVADFERVVAACTAADAEQGLTTSGRRVDAVIAACRDAGSDGSPSSFREEVLKALVQRDREGYQRAHDTLSRAVSSREVRARREELIGRITPHAPELAERLLSVPSEPEWRDRLQGFSAGWEWAKASAWLDKWFADHPSCNQATELDEAECRTRSIAAELASAQAWRYCLRRLTPELRSALEAWRQVQQRLGKRRGKYVRKWDEESRNCMRQCTTAIPAWVMPVHRVCETIPVKAGSFDAVVIDEASQSSTEALLLCYLGRKVVVVGDDKQISPVSFVNQQEEGELRERHVADLPFANLLGAAGSLFDAAQVRFRDRIRLREHFRSMPEIIEFSNALCYADAPLIPMRQYGNERLEPVRSTHITEGKVEGKGQNQVNRQEAEAVVGAVRECLTAGAYRGKTMGVITLLGQKQQELIERMLLRDPGVGPEVMEQRRLVCGDAYTFQGDERDVVFLSLVAAPADNHRLAVLNQTMHVQRFNVAVSRARDQCWLFHSVTLADITNPECVRHKLLEHFLGPSRGVAFRADAVTGALLLELRSAERSPGSEPPDPFDSWFEADVFTHLAERGYRVTPQYPAHGYRIDLVVDGARTRLAVECDGDHWHGPERYEADMKRQRALERCGWQFWRLRGSEFCRSADDSLLGLWRLLNELDIQPVDRPLMKA